MSDVTPNPKTFDLGAVLAGQSYPSEVIDIYFDEATAYSITKLSQIVKQLAVAGGQEFDDAEKELYALIDSMKERKYEFHIQGVPNHIYLGIRDRVNAEIPERRNSLGIAEDDPKRDELYVAMIFETFITKIVAPDGAEIVRPTLESIKDLRANAPKHALKKIEDGINNLAQSVAAGFEITVRSTDFLSKP